MGFDDPDTGKTLPDHLGQIGEGTLNFLVSSVHFSAEEPRADNQQRHGNQYQQCQFQIDVGHETDGCGPQDERIIEGHQTHSHCHAYLLDVVGGVGHQIAGLRPVEIGRRQGLNVRQKLVAQTFLHPPRSSE